MVCVGYFKNDDRLFVTVLRYVLLVNILPQALHSLWAWWFIAEPYRCVVINTYVGFVHEIVVDWVQLRIFLVPVVQHVHVAYTSQCWWHCRNMHWKPCVLAWLCLYNVIILYQFLCMHTVGTCIYYCMYIVCSGATIETYNKFMTSLGCIRTCIYMTLKNPICTTSDFAGCIGFNHPASNNSHRHQADEG